MPMSDAISIAVHLYSSHLQLLLSYSRSPSSLEIYRNQFTTT